MTRQRLASLTTFVCLAVIGALAAGPFSARAQVDWPPRSTTTTTSSTSTTSTTQQPTTTTTQPTTSTTRPPSTTTTTTEPTRPTLLPDPDPDPNPRPDPDPNPAPEPEPTEPGPGTSDPSDPTADPLLGDGGTAGRGVVPPEYQAIISSIKRSKANNTRALLDALQPLTDLGVEPLEIVKTGMGRFPVGGYATFVDDWYFPRFVPTFHLHEGTDIFAAAGTPVRSPANGVLKQSNGPVGGLAAYVTQPDGTYFYMAHLSGFVEGQLTGQQVKVGDIVGYVGDSGNARGGAPHVHFEVHPKGGGPTNPKPILDQMLIEALGSVPAVIAAYEQARPRALVATGLTRRFSGGGESVFAAPNRPPQSQLLWASSANPSGGALALAEAEAANAAGAIDWRARARREEARAAAWRQANAAASTLLDPLTPRALLPSLGRTAPASGR